MSDVSGKTVMITGASRGIGESAARAFAAAGANVVLTARSGSAIDAIAEEIGDTALAVACDVADYAQVEAAVAAAVDKFGGVDVLINNAGVVEPISHLDQSDPSDWGQVIDINLKGVYHGMRAVMPMMEQAGGGSILTISSGAAHGPVEAWSHYCASKAAVNMLTRCVHKEAGEKGIRAIGLSPGTVATQMQREIKASGINPVSKLEWTDHIPPEWPAKCLLWMCSSAADDWLGDEISLRDEDIRRKVGLI
ncbi:NADP-dependent 3-hydroxy acid dehydrogenase YdfG [Shimia isoporae]|uniref:NADP-dependent 3-hydroxy acid dehydrogenase YdfG n=1 Tax=Shimia isoporae TaxID=647720 RepID=A0A4R1N4P1_9RHOB|nr:SDR family oxidoreductase [Shimia isoporae]TCL00685.1 NADP-dependent 3-hydroxy acid dehydrogenase YdfG [Shimia isoporae]